MKTSISYDEWQAAISEVARRRVDDVPPGWVLPEELMAPGRLTRAGTSEVHARHLLTGLFTAGKVDRKKFMIENKQTGTIRSVYHYRLKK